MKIWRETMIYQVFADLEARRRTAFLAPLAILGLGYLVLLLLPVVPAIQDRMMRKFHWQSANFAEWAVLQTLPSMYSFYNEYWLSPQPHKSTELTLLSEAAKRSDTLVWYGRVNHYPPRIMTFPSRQAYQKAPYDLYFQFRSTYRDNRIESQYRLTKTDMGFRVIDLTDELK